MISMTSLTQTPMLTPFFLQFLEISCQLASEQTGGAATSTETGDGAVPPRTDTEEDEDETGDEPD